MDFDFNKIKEMGLEYAEKGRNAAMDLAERGRTQAKIVSEQTKLARAQRQLGALVYSLAKGNEENQPLVDKYIEMIGSIEANLTALRESLGPAAEVITHDLDEEPAEDSGITVETTVEKDVAFGLKHSGLSAAEKQARARWALETVGFSFEKVHDQPPMGLSGGEKRRVAIAGVLATKPEYLILAEPIAGLDPLGREAFLQLITELNRGGMTILMVSHNADCLGAYAQRLLVLEDGQLVRDGTPEEIYAALDWMRARRLGVPQSRTAAALLRQGGLDIPQDIASYDALLAAVLRAKGGGRP